MRVLLVIPARVGSTRLPAKPLCPLFGEPLVRHTVRTASSYDIDAKIVVATDDERVRRAVEPLGVEAVMTQPGHRSGTERVAEVAAQDRFGSVDVVVNVQGDEPFLPAEAVMGMVARVEAGDPIGTAAAPLGKGALQNPDRVKVLLDRDGYARWFGRDCGVRSEQAGARPVLQHVGCYAYTREALREWVRLPELPAERQARLEQLRPLGFGLKIGVAVLRSPVPRAVDTPEDVRYWEARGLVHSYG